MLCRILVPCSGIDWVRGGREIQAKRQLTIVQRCGNAFEYGKFDDYMNYLGTTWKAEQEAAKKAGNIISYRVIVVEPRDENDPDIYLVTNYKNWAALDNAIAKNDAIAKQVQGSLAASNKSAVDRGKIRRVLGAWTGRKCTEVNANVKRTRKPGLTPGFLVLWRSVHG